MVLKCWLDDKLKNSNIETHVPICAVDDVERKYEFTLLARNRHIAVSYTHERINLSDEKFDILESNSKDIKIIYIVDKKNSGSSGQYPESLMKIQHRQGYCLYLSISDIDYYKAKLKAVFFAQDIDGFWQEITFASGLISDFDISENGSLSLNGKFLSKILEDAKAQFRKDCEEIREQREKEAKRRAEERKKLQEEEARRQEEIEKKRQEQIETAEKFRVEQEQKRKLAEIEHKQKEDAFKKALASNFKNQDTQIRDADGNRWVQCEFCDKIALEKEFSSYGGLGHINLGTCKECSKNNPNVHKYNIKPAERKPKQYAPNICPECGGQLREKIGRLGRFIGCSSYPQCGYTRSIKRKNK